ncbi:ABC-2 transporter permease [Sedimentibacter hydroxybenzoicus DSM 7310]|uniref:ABC-2 transporter permease n=1 Tax=Sedimentibacter hydroxybenzoicus DSM 7310 TaxID=1123245 RepID=A0A974GWE5_SEDHY|nr:ABC-2 transporter permease [Sedimentibacter hydroxybenzoicus]NYB74363.1 ABC-2 transporter permease [Sedimentibacter hydroxybenzoicus DSM 7310]
MIGLIIKDLINLKKLSKIYLLILLFYFIVSIAGGNQDMFGGMIVMLAVMIPITALSYDEKNKWDRYALTMPLMRGTIVLSKYILGLIFLIAAFTLAFITNIIFTEIILYENLMINLTTFSVGIIMISFILPIILKFGVEKGRILMMIVIFTPVAIIVMLPKLGIPAPEQETIEMFLKYLPVAAIITYVLSILVSVSIYKKKEF